MQKYYLMMILVLMVETFVSVVHRTVVVKDRPDPLSVKGEQKNKRPQRKAVWMPGHWKKKQQPFISPTEICPLPEPV